MASSSQSSRIRYDVFISFRGTDVRHGFLSHLRKELHQKQIDAYVDARLESGDEISPALLRAIEESHILLIIFSKDYASSKWCLEELVKIIECMDRHKQIVIPVFYNIDPSDVRHQKGSYGNALAELDKYYKERVQVWRSALNKAANLSGFHSSNYGDEVELIEEIVKYFSTRLNTMYQSDLADLVGIDERIADLESLMCPGLNDVRIIGIWGMGGIGKTTIAIAVFNQFYFNYEGCCLFANVREEAEKYGIIYLKNKILSILLKESNMQIDTPIGIPPNVKRRLLRKKVLVVLDDIIDSNQLENLFGAFDCFGSGSRIIITTRDKKVFGNKVDQIYEVKPLIFDYAFQLFMLKAFKQNCVDMELIELSKMVTSYAQGIPLALKVLGSFLYGKSKEEWKSQLKKLKKMPCTEVHDVLRLSYDSLDDEEKDIFLYIACFFKGYEQHQIIALLDACGFSTIIGLKVLQDKALITKIKRRGSEILIISMHDLIQQMGKEIVRRESKEDPGKRSRLWDPSDIYEVLKNNTGTEAVQSIILDHSKVDEELFLDPQVFAKMHRLKFLKICHRLLRLPQGLGSLPNELRLFHWPGYPLESLPSAFCAKDLVELDMTESNVKKLWDGVVPFVNLKKINLRRSEYLLELPDFSMANNLQEVSLKNCRNLSLVHPSILSLHKLQILDLSFCTKLTSLRSNVHLRSLYQLVLRGCSRLKEFSVTSENMSELDLSGTTIEELPSSIGNLNKLAVFSLYNCRSLTHLPSNLVNLRSLWYLNICDCTQLRSLTDLPPSIKIVYATNCTSLETVRFTSVAADPLNRDLVAFSLENCMKLDEHILNVFGSNAYLNLINYAFKQISPEERKIDMLDIEPVATYPGSKVPNWFKYRSSQASITIALRSKLQAFIFCVIVTQSPSAVKIDCFIHGGRFHSFRTGIKNFHSNKLISDHVFLWYDEIHCDWINERTQERRARNQNISYNPEVSFKFYPLGRQGIMMKECGVYPIYASECNNFIKELELKSELGNKTKRSRDIDDSEPIEIGVGIPGSHDLQSFPRTKKMK